MKLSEIKSILTNPDNGVDLFEEDLDKLIEIIGKCRISKGKWSEVEDPEIIVKQVLQLF
jgi:hypothetical protein